MNDILDIELILQKQKYSNIYNIGVILLIIILIFLYISCTYKYKTYYITKGTIQNNQLEVLVNIDDFGYVVNNNILEINGNRYKYEVNNISENLYVDENLNNYKYFYLNIDNLNNKNNYVYQIKLEKENKKIIEYIKDYL